MPADFGKRLTWILERRGMSPADLHYAAHVDRASIFRFLRGEQEPRLESLARIAQATGASIDFLAGLSDEPWLPAKNPFQKRAVIQ